MSSTLNAALSNSLSALEVNQASMTVVSNNISNSNNPDYSQQELITSPGVDGEGNLSYGSGVEILGVQGIRDNLLNQRLAQETSLQSGADTLSSSLGAIQPLVSDDSSSGLLQSLTGFFNSFQTLATNPSSTSFQQQVQSSAQNMIAGFQQLNGNLKAQQTQADQGIAPAVAQINSLSSQIANINSQISQQGSSSDASNLLDQRESLVQQISKIANVQELNTGGTYELTIGNGQPLVNGSQAFSLTAQAVNGKTEVYSDKTDITSQITSGSMGAALSVRDNYIPTYLNAADDLAASIIQQVNTISASGYNANGTTGVNFFTPLSSSIDASADLSLSSAVAADPGNIATSSTTGGGDNQVATQLGNLLFQPVFNGGTVTSQYGNLVYQIGADASNANTASSEHDALAQQLQAQQQSISGVSIDEETTQMLQFQRAYQASARMVSAVDTLTQTVLGMATGTA